MSWDDRYFAAPPRASRVLFALAGLVMWLFGSLLVLGGLVHKGNDHLLRVRLVILLGAALGCYGVDLVVRAIRPRKPGRTFAGVSGALRLVGAIVLASLLLGSGVFGMVRGDLLAGGFLVATGLGGMLLVLFARARSH